MMRKIDKVSQALIKAGGALLLTLRDYRKKNIENERLALLSVLLLKSITSPANTLLKKVANSAAMEQKSDGGWVEVEDTAWRLALLGHYEQYHSQRLKGLRWLNSMQLPEGGWGRSGRDRARIPVTATLLFLIQDIHGGKRALKWLEQEILREIQLSPVLTYKLAFTLLADTKQTKSNGGISRNVKDGVREYLISQQDVSGGWGYCKNHPVGTTPFCTALALSALVEFFQRENAGVIHKGADWLLQHQIENGLWSEHYIEEGSAWALYGLSEYYRWCKKNEETS